MPSKVRILPSPFPFIIGKIGSPWFPTKIPQNRFANNLLTLTLMVDLKTYGSIIPIKMR